MVKVVLKGNWTDAAGTPHQAGTTVEVNANTLAELSAAGLVTSNSPATVTTGSTGGSQPAWGGPTGDGD